MASYNVSDRLLNALIKQESGGNNKAVSKVGARGVTQVMPKTAQDPGFGVQPMRDQSEGEYRRFGRDYLGAMLKRYDGDLNKALAAYNAGPGRVDKANGVPNIPETQKYVKNILNTLNPIGSAQASDDDPGDWVNESEYKPQQAQTNDDPGDWVNEADYKPQEQIEWKDVPGNAVKNFIPDMGALIEGTAQAIAHPIDTTQGLLNLANSAVQKALPDSINEFLYKINPKLRDNKELINNVGNVLIEKLGSEDAIKKTLSENPAQVLSFVAPVIGAAGKVSGINALQKAGSVLDPLSSMASLTSGAIGKAAPKLGSLIGKGVASYGTHTGADTINDAARSGLVGGKKLKDFKANMRGYADMNDVVDEASTALKNIKSESRIKYNQGMESIRVDNTVLNFDPVIDSAKESMQAGRYKGVSIDSSAAKVQTKIIGEIKRWSKLDPTEYHTAGGFDALKRKIGDIRSETQPGTPARVAADNLYHSIKNEIIKQHPGYRNVMEDSSKRIKNAKGIEKDLSLGEKSLENPDQAIRKFQSIPRNNANTNYGNRIKMAQQLENAGAENLISKVNAQQLSSIQPRGLAGTITGGLAGFGVATANPALAIPLILSSPRAAGELAVGMGITARKLKDMAKTTQGKGFIADYLYKANALNDASHKSRP